MNLGYRFRQFVQKSIIAIHLLQRVPSSAPSLTMLTGQRTNPFEEFHVFTTHPGLTELEQLMGCRGIMQHYLKNLCTEEVGDTTSGNAIAIGGICSIVCGLLRSRQRSLRSSLFRC